MALVSDAGLPGVNDPGARLVAVAIEHGIPVTVLPGPSAVETALVASGLVGERYAFVGYLPRGAERARPPLGRSSPRWTWPAVAFESPKRLPASLASLAAFDPDRPVAVCRELTKKFEEVVRGPAAEVADALRRAAEGRDHAGRSARARRRSPSEDEAIAAVAELVAAGFTRKDAAGLVARLTGVPRNRLYKSSL